jgi:hypothetical protein
MRIYDITSSETSSETLDKQLLEIRCNFIIRALIRDYKISHIDIDIDFIYNLVSVDFEIDISKIVYKVKGKKRKDVINKFLDENENENENKDS